MLSDAASKMMGFFLTLPILDPKRQNSSRTVHISTLDIAVGWKSPAKKLYRTESVFIKKVVLAAHVQ